MSFVGANPLKIKSYFSLDVIVKPFIAHKINYLDEHEYSVKAFSYYIIKYTYNVLEVWIDITKK